jgi:hypothetical protein
MFYSLCFLLVFYVAQWCELIKNYFYLSRSLHGAHSIHSKCRYVISSCSVSDYWFMLHGHDVISSLLFFL